jgi:very-short-patch-repair endonuclease
MMDQSSGYRTVSPTVYASRRCRQEMSFEQMVLWQNLRGNRLLGLHFRRMHHLEGYIIDFFCYSKRLALEVRGSAVDEDGEFDSYKDLTLAAAGVRTIRFTKSEVRYQLPKVLQRIREACSL